MGVLIQQSFILLKCTAISMLLVWMSSMSLTPTEEAIVPVDLVITKAFDSSVTREYNSDIQHIVRATQTKAPVYLVNQLVNVRQSDITYSQPTGGFIE